MRSLIKSTPVIGYLAKLINHRIKKSRSEFDNSESYWNKRYDDGGNSGAGSYNELATFKADIINDFVRENKISSVIEFGCGDGNQLTLSEYPSYMGFDVSPKALEICRKLFANDKTKQFDLMRDYTNQTADLAMSLDVIYHLIEDNVFDQYMKLLFKAADSYVMIYSSDTTQQHEFQSPHVRHRKFSDWVSQHANGWELIEHIPNKYPYNHISGQGSFAHFYIYQQKQ